MTTEIREQSAEGAGLGREDFAIVLENVKKNFDVKGRKAPVRALRGVYASIERGTMIAIKGDSGSGKTTLLQMMGALDTPTSGSVMVNGKDLSELSEESLTRYRAKTVGFVFQSFNLIPNLSALENVELAMEALNVPKSERRIKAAELLRAVGMEDRMDHKPSKLSGGEQQRVAIARALANDPSIILADEPTGNLDTKTGKAIIELLRQLRRERGKTVLIVTHSNRAAKACDKMITIKDGILASEQKRTMIDHDRGLKSTMREVLEVSGKVISKLFDADYTDFETIANADENDLARILGDKGLARKIMTRAGNVQDEIDSEDDSDEDDEGKEEGDGQSG
jgi:putative ABC transport system ATP-binding protein